MVNGTVDAQCIACVRRARAILKGRRLPLGIEDAVLLGIEGPPLGFWGMPYTVIIAPNGEVARKDVGAVTADDLIGEIETILARR